jgi:uncharacterized protein with HEPN domain
MQLDDALLRDIVAAADIIARRIANRSLDDFLADDALQDGVLLRLIFIGEAAAQLPPAVRQRSPEVPWSDAIAFRNRVVHGYATINWTIVWRTAIRSIPVLREQVAAILARDYPPDSIEEEPTP